MVFSQPLTPFVTPVFYVLHGRPEKWLAKTFPSLPRARKGAAEEQTDVITQPGAPKPEVVAGPSSMKSRFDVPHPVG